MIEQLQLYLRRYANFSHSEVESIYQCLELKTFEKKAFLLKEGQICREYFFLIEGLVRSFYWTEKGRENVTQFAIENWWVTNLDSFRNETASWLNIQAVEKTTVLCLSRTKLEQLFVEIPKVERLFRIITEQTLIASQRRADFFLRKSSKERYQFFMQHLASFAQRIPQYMLASYLEITPEYLSELRKMRK